MTSNMDSTFQDFQGDEFFDFDAASGGVAGPILSCYTDLDIEMGGSVNNDYQQRGTSANDMYQLPDNFAMDNSVRAEFEPALQPTGNMTVEHNLPDHSNDFQINEMESGTSTGTHDPFDSNPVTQTILEPLWPIDNQQLQGSSMRCVPPSEGGQSGVEDMVTTQRRTVIRCPWPSCVAGNLHFRDEADASVHYSTAHQDALLSAPWNGTIKCSWPNCSSKTMFKHKYLLKTHLANIHVAPLRCDITGCSYPKPFGKQSDLDRHVSAVHGSSAYFCTVESCVSSTIGFGRKDKLVKHMREEHDNVRCTINHCDSILLDGEQEEHLQEFHGTYECALGACERGLPSYFSWDAARLHLIRVHKMDIYASRSIVTRSEDKTIRPNVVYSRKPIVECQGCMEYIHTAN